MVFFKSCTTALLPASGSAVDLTSRIVGGGLVAVLVDGSGVSPGRGRDDIQDESPSSSPGFPNLQKDLSDVLNGVECKLRTVRKHPVSHGLQNQMAPKEQA